MLFQSEIAWEQGVRERQCVWRAAGDRGWPEALGQRVGTRGQGKTCEGSGEKERVSECWEGSRAGTTSCRAASHSRNLDFFPNVSEI